MKPDYHSSFQLIFIHLLFSLVLAAGCTPPDKNASSATNDSTTNRDRIRIVDNDNMDRVDIFYGDRLFTSYLHPDAIKKPVLFPLHTASGIEITRGFPLQPKPGDRIDHPHHVGMWLNHGNVNDLDFWNNSDSIPSNRLMGYGTIYHKNVKRTRDGDDQGFLEVTAEWKRPDGRTILDENTKFYFSGTGNTRIIDRITTLTASEIQVLFKDSKEGMMAIRVARELEQPSRETVTVLNENLEPVNVQPGSSNRPKGLYTNSEGQSGDDVWGKRAMWVKLASEINGTPVGIVMMDHPDNPNHPAHWHARGYGLFAVNPFGARMYTDGREDFNFFLPQDESVTLKYRVLIYENEEPDATTINSMFEQFAATY